MLTKKVTKILDEFYKGNLSKTATIEKLQNAKPLDLYMAEMDLIDKGLSADELADISDIYLNIVKGKSRELIFKLDENHPVRILMLEHEKIKSLLLVLEGLLKENKLEKNKDKFEDVLENFKEVNKHIRREEEVIFPLLRKKEFAGRTMLLSEEHDDFIKILDNLEFLTSKWNDSIDKIREYSNEVIYNLRMHTFVEDDMFYPVILNLLEDWDEIKKEHDKIGYCKFKTIKS